MFDKEKYFKILKQYIPNENLQKHCLATQVVMRDFAKHFGEDEEKWELTGLLHDLDYAKTANNPEKHSLISAEILQNMGMPEDVVYAVKVHNEFHGLPRKKLLDKVLYAVDPLTGLIVAAALIKPEKKLKAIDVPFLLNRFSEKSFAKGANRQQIMSCEEFDMSLEDFMEISLKAMQSIDDELGL